MTEGRKILRQQTALVILLAVVGCEGPMGPPGEQGPPGPPGPTPQSLLIEFPLSRFSYSEDGEILLANPQIRPATFRALFFKFINDSSREDQSGEWATVYMPYTTFVSFMQQALLSGTVQGLAIIISAVSQGFSFEVQEDAEGLPEFAGYVVGAGGIEIYDPDRILLEFAEIMQFDEDISISFAVLVQP